MTILDSLLEDGWRDAKEDPPDSDRTVLIRWDDGSGNENTKGFYDSVSSIPQNPEKWWWSKTIEKLPHGSVLAWKDIDKQ